MDRRVLTAVLVAVAVMALGVTAGTVGNLETDSGEDPEPRTPTGPERTTVPDDRGDGSSIGCPGPLDSGPGLLAGLVVVGLLAAASYRVTGSALPSLVVGPPLVLWLVGTCGAALPVIEPLFGAVSAAFSASLTLMGVVLLALVGAVVLLLVDTEFGSLTDSGFETDDRPGGTDLSGVGDAAGAAADRIETQADVTNEVYRAWAEMTGHLSVVDPDATTPEEFAEAAIAAGMAADDVERLTDLFRDVRYGGADPDSRAEAAVETLRRIERAYGSESP